MVEKTQKKRKSLKVSSRKEINVRGVLELEDSFTLVTEMKFSKKDLDTVTKKDLQDFVIVELARTFLNENRNKIRFTIID